MVKRGIYLLLLAFLTSTAWAQSPARFDLPVVTTTPAQVPVGSLPSLLAVTNATISVCGYPAVLVQGMCTNTISTYTDSTLSTACPSTAQLTAPGTTVCIPTTGLQGTFGFWYDAAIQSHLTYTIKTSWGTYGPFDIQSGGGGSGCAQGTCVKNLPTGVTAAAATQTIIQPSISSVQSTLAVNSLNSYFHAEQFQSPVNTGNNGIANATAACPSTGCTVDVAPNYSQTEVPQGYQVSTNSFTWPTNTEVRDNRGGVEQFGFYDPASSSPATLAGIKQITDFDRFPLSQATFGGFAGNEMSQNIQSNFYTGFRNTMNDYGGIPTTVYGGFHVGLMNQLNAWDSGQKFNHWDVTNCRATGDCIWEFEQMSVDGGVNGVDDEGAKIADLGITEDVNVFTGTISGAVSTGATTIPTNCTAGCLTQGQDRLLIDTASAKDITGTWSVGFGAPTMNPSNIPPTVTDASATFPVSTMFYLCYPGSDNGAGGATGCTPGGTPAGYIPPNASSPSKEQPNTPLTLNVLASWASTPSGFCTSANLQSSNPAGSCYAPASGTLCLTDSNEYETVNYTFNSTTQTVTITNMRFPHSNAMVAAVGGLCGYAEEVAADIWTATGTGGSGVQSQVFPIAGSISPTTIYYVPQRTNEGYGPAVLGISGDQNTGVQSGQLSFSTSGSAFAVSTGVASFSMTQPANTVNPFSKYNGLAVNISVPGNTTYNCTTCVITWQGGNNFTYSSGTATGTATTGTVSFSNMQYKLYPSARIDSVYNTATRKIDGNLYVEPNAMAWTNGDPIRVPHYQQIQVSGVHQNITAFLPSQAIGTNGADIVYNGLPLSPGSVGFQIKNAAPASAFLGYGGTHESPYFGLGIYGVWDTTIDAAAPNSNFINFSACKAVIGCTNSGASWTILRFPQLPNAQSGFSQDYIDYHPEYLESARNNGLTSGEILTSPLLTYSPGYLVAQQASSAPSMTTSNLTTTALTNFPGNAFAVVGGTGSTSYTYYIVGHGTDGGTTAAQKMGPAGATLTNGPATLSGTNYIVLEAFLNPGFSSYDFYKGDTLHLLGSATAGNGATCGLPANYACVKDIGQALTAQTAPSVNTTGGAYIVGPLRLPNQPSIPCLGTDSNGVVGSGSGCGGGITLTTTGTSGASTLSGGVLNIPIYAGGGSLPTGAIGNTLVNSTGSTTYVATNISKTPVQLYGVTAYTTEAAAEAGPDDTANFQSAVTAGVLGTATCQAGKWYHVDGPLNFAQNEGLIGTSNQTYALLCNLVSNSATANILSNASGGAVIWANLGIYRSVAPTGTAAGLYATSASGMIVENIQTYDSVYDVYRNQTPDGGGATGRWDHIQAGWKLSESTGTYYGFYDDSANGLPWDSTILSNSQTGCQGLTGTAIGYGYINIGTQIEDNDTYNFSTAGCSYGQVANYTGSAANDIGASDIHWWNSTHDAFKVSGFLLQNIKATNTGSVEISGGWAVGPNAGSTGADIDCETSSGITIDHMLAGAHANALAGNPAVIYANNCSNLSIADNIIMNGSNGGITLDGAGTNGTHDTAVTGNSFVGSPGTMPQCVLIKANSANNTVTGNTFANCTNGLSLNGSAKGNVYAGNSLGASVTTGVSDTSSSATNGYNGMEGIFPTTGNPIMVGQSATVGQLGFSIGDATHTGYMGFYLAGTRQGYIGFDTGGLGIKLQAGNFTIGTTSTPGVTVTSAGAVTAASLNGLTTPTAAGLAIFTQNINNGTAAMEGGTAIAAGACATTVTVASASVVTTDVIAVGFNSDPTSTTGYIPGAMLTIVPYPTAGNVNFKLCNNTASSITPTAITINWRVNR